MAMACVLEDLQQIIQRGAAALTPAENELLKWLGVFFRRPTPGKFMMRVRMPNGFATSAQLRVIGDLSRRIRNNVLDITTRQQIELRGFTLKSVPEIWDKVDSQERAIRGSKLAASAIVLGTHSECPEVNHEHLQRNLSSGCDRRRKS